jgi:hypothetical protein
MTPHPVQPTRSAVDSWWMRNAETRAEQWVNSRNPPPGFGVEAARSGVVCEFPLNVRFI